MNSSIMTTADINTLFRVLYTHPFDGNLWKLITIFIHENKLAKVKFTITDNPLHNHQHVFKIHKPIKDAFDRMKENIVKYKSYKVAQQLLKHEEQFAGKAFFIYESNGDPWYHLSDNNIVYVNSGIGFIDAMVENLINGKED